MQVMHPNVGFCITLIDMFLLLDMCTAIPGQMSKGGARASAWTKLVAWMDTKKVSSNYVQTTSPRIEAMVHVERVRRFKLGRLAVVESVGR